MTINKEFQSVLSKTHWKLLHTLNLRLSFNIFYMDLSLLVINMHCTREYNITSLGIRDCCCSAAQKLHSFFRVLSSEEITLFSTSESSAKRSATKQDLKYRYMYLP